MKRILLALSTLLFAFSGFSQRYDPSADIDPTTYTIGVTYTPSFNYRTYRVTDKTNAFQTFLKEQNDSLNGIMPMSNFGLSMVFELSQSFSLEVGANVGDRGYRTSKNVQPNNLINYTKQIVKFRYVNIPIKARIYLNQGPTQFYASFGASAGLRTTAKTINEISNNTQNSSAPFVQKKVRQEVNYRDDNLNRFNASAIIGFGFRTYIGKRGVLNFEPNFNRSVLNLNKDEEYKIRLYQIGMTIGYSIELN